MQNYVQAGNALTVTAPSGGVTSGSGVLLGHLFGVAATSAVEGEQYELVTTGVFELPKVDGDLIGLGEPVYWDVSENAATSAATGNLRIGTAVRASGVGPAAEVMISGHAV